MNPTLATLRPSNLPILAKSPLFQPGLGSSFALDGTARHRALAMQYSGDPGALVGLEDDEADAVLWAVDQIKLLAPILDFPVEFEKRLSVTLPDFSEISGTADVVCGPVIVDLKSRPRRYDEQLACYALGLMDENPDLPLVRCHILFGSLRRVQTLEFDYDGALELVWSTVEKARAAEVCAVSEYCGWCAIRHRCPIYTEKALAVAAGREDWPLPKTFHASETEDPEELGKMLRLARLLRPWCESVEHHALESATKRGLVPDGFALAATRGKSYVNDVTGAFALAGLSQADFLRCCDVRLNTSDSYPDKVGVIDLYATQHGMKRAPAAREVKAKLAPVITTGAGGLKLKETNTEPEKENANV